MVLGLHSKDRKSTRDKAYIGNPKVNKGCPPLTANRTSADRVQISLGPSMQYIQLRVYHTGSFNTMKHYNLSWNSHIEFIQTKVTKYIWIRNRLKCFLPLHILKHYMVTLFHSDLNYSLLAWGFNCRRIKLIQTKCIRIITVSK